MDAFSISCFLIPMLCFSKWSGTKEMQVVAITCTDEKGSWVTRCTMKCRGGEIICLSFPIFHWTEYCRQACILYAAASVHASNTPSPWMLHSQTAFLNIEWEKGENDCSDAVNRKHCCVTSVLLLLLKWCSARFFRNISFSESSANLKGSVPYKIQINLKMEFLQDVVRSFYMEYIPTILNIFATYLLQMSAFLSLSAVSFCVRVCILYVMLCLSIRWVITGNWNVRVYSQHG